MAKEVWRLVDRQAIRCTECMMNLPQLGGEDLCSAPDEVCVFMKKKIDRQKTWEDFHEAYAELNNEMTAAENGGEAL